MRVLFTGPVARFWMVAAAMLVMPVALHASGIDEGSHHHYNIDIHYIEVKPNADVQDEQRAHMRQIYKRFDPVEVEADEAQGRQADRLALENGFLDIPHPLYDALIQELARYKVRAYPTFFTSLRSSEQAEKLRRQLASKYHAYDADADYILSLQPYQATLKGTSESVVWIGVRLQNRRTNSSNLYYLSLPFDKERHHGFGRDDGKRAAVALVNWMVRQGLIDNKE